MYLESLADVVVAKLEVLVELSSSRVPGLVLLQHWLWSFKFGDTKKIGSFFKKVDMFNILIFFEME
jgi:hypothetical protein